MAIKKDIKDLLNNSNYFGENNTNPKDISDRDRRTGFEYLEDNPPISGEFDQLQYENERKSFYLYKTIEAVIKSEIPEYNPQDDKYTDLLDSIAKKFMTFRAEVQKEISEISKNTKKLTENAYTLTDNKLIKTDVRTTGNYYLKWKSGSSYTSLSCSDNGLLSLATVTNGTKVNSLEQTMAGNWAVNGGFSAKSLVSEEVLVKQDIQAGGVSVKQDIHAGGDIIAVKNVTGDVIIAANTFEIGYPYKDNYAYIDCGATKSGKSMRFNSIWGTPGWGDELTQKIGGWWYISNAPITTGARLSYTRRSNTNKGEKGEVLTGIHNDPNILRDGGEMQEYNTSFASIQIFTEGHWVTVQSL